MILQRIKKYHKKMGPGRTGSHGHLGKDGLQAQKVKEPGDPKGQNNWKVPATGSRGSDPKHLGEPDKMPWKVV